MLTLASYMDERSAHYKQEALGRVRVALAGSLPNCFYSLLTDLFGYPSTPDPQPFTSAPTATAPTASTAPPAAPLLQLILPCTKLSQISAADLRPQAPKRLSLHCLTLMFPGPKLFCPPQTATDGPVQAWHQNTSLL